MIAQGLSTARTSSSALLKKKYPMARPVTIAMKTPPLKDMAASIRRYPMAELTPNSTAPANLAGFHRPPPAANLWKSRGVWMDEG
ncbi:hypothetical protein U1Q18_036756 [Sarracenia purpurea var. burkii]